MKSINVISSALTLAAASIVALTPDQVRRRLGSLELLDDAAAKSLGMKASKGLQLARAKSGLVFKVGEAVDYLAGPSANHRHIQTVTDAGRSEKVFEADIAAEFGADAPVAAKKPRAPRAKKPDLDATPAAAGQAPIAAEGDPLGADAGDDAGDQAGDQADDNQAGDQADDNQAETIEAAGSELDAPGAV